jgi:carbonic anhydrase
MPRPQIDAGFPSRLVDGFKAFHYGTLRRERERYERLAASGQRPDIMIVACCDSRAAPETLFDAAPGEIFVVRNVANIVPPYGPAAGHHGTPAALEFAVQELKVGHILVMGHGRCGGVGAFLRHRDRPDEKPLSPGDFIGKWMTLLEPATRDLRCEETAAEDIRRRALEEAGVRNSLANIATYPCVRILVERRRIALHGAWFDISGGQLWVMDAATGEFAPLAV